MLHSTDSHNVTLRASEEWMYLTLRHVTYRVIEGMTKQKNV